MKNLAKWLLFSTALTPLIFSAESLFPYVFPKAVFFRSVVFAATMAVAILAITSADFRTTLAARLRIFWRHPLGKAVTFMMAGLAVSTIFAFDRQMAFFGNIERAEGFIGIFFFYIALVLSHALFERKDWMRFFWANQFSGLILFFIAAIAALQGTSRPGALVDNPIFLAVYFLFLAYAALVLYRHGRTEKQLGVRVGAGVFLTIALLGILITQTRGVILGMLAGGLVVLAYLAVVRGNRTVGGYRIRVVSLALGATLILFSGVFVATRQAEIWKHVPGLSRLAATSLGDATTDSRLVMAKITLRAVTSHEAGVKNMLVGWGWDNFVYAWQKFYDPALYHFDGSSFDRAHDKILDVILMTGFVGLVLYLAVWFFIFRSILKIGKERSAAEASFALLFATAFFIQNLTVFDVLVTFLAWFAFIGYIIFSTENDQSVKTASSGVIVSTGAVALAIFLGIAVFAWTVVPYSQNTKYRAAMDEIAAGRTPAVLLADDPIFSSDNFAQRIIRDSFLRTTIEAYNTRTLKADSPLFDRAVAVMESYLSDHKPIYTNYLTLGSAYTGSAILKQDPLLFEKARESYKKAMALIPGRQDVMYSYAINLLQSGREDEAVKLLTGMVQADPSLPQNHYQLGQAYLVLKASDYPKALEELEYSLNHGVDMQPAFTRRAYQQMLTDFYKKKDVARFKVTVARLSEIDPVQGQTFKSILEYMNAHNTIPPIDMGSQ